MSCFIKNKKQTTILKKLEVNNKSIEKFNNNDQIEYIKVLPPVEFKEYKKFINKKLLITIKIYSL